MPREKPPAVVTIPYWAYWIPVVTALVSALNALGLAYINAQFGTAQTEVVKSVDKLETQINSNMSREIEAAIEKAIAQERLRVELRKK